MTHVSVSRRVLVVLAAALTAFPLSLLRAGSASADTVTGLFTCNPFKSYDVRPAVKPLELKSDPKPLDVRYSYRGAARTLDDLLNRTGTESFLVLHGDKLVSERYFRGNSRSTVSNSDSVAKSIVSAAVGVAVGEGAISSVHDPVTKYVPELKGSGFDGASIRDVLHMASGIEWQELQKSYFDPTNSATFNQIRLTLGTPATEIAQQAKRAEAPGTHFNYASIDTFVLSWVVSRATHEPFARYLQDRIWQPAGMSSTTRLGADWAGNPLGFTFVTTTPRNFARFGLLYLHNGRALGKQVVPAQWVADSTHSSEPYLQPDQVGHGYGLGYGYQWWLGDGDRGDYSALGVFGQYIYVNPRDNVVIVKTSFDPQHQQTINEMITAFRAVADKVASS
ncbi:hypothetical protein GCM10012275_00230 [Longimycelium tulufanense]|uniref:Beta-lactamase-related domain-containing protein n=1 Tax=Longimycelium tulufanense TaxID=907463 RepID=A0A8J3FSV6_9PSEU|nr:serine hydrolase [Longimycelium tulufanense]GGM32771.1 hypothetical protein GCM10012275_00230 [Longimycelium tulufanense]